MQSGRKIKALQLFLDNKKVQELNKEVKK